MCVRVRETDRESERERESGSGCVCVCMIACVGVCVSEIANNTAYLGSFALLV